MSNPLRPVARLTMITLGVSNMRASIAFYQALGFTRKFRATGEVVAFFDTGGTAIGLFPWDQLAQDVTLPERPRPEAFRGVTLGWNCRSAAEVDTVLDFAVAQGASLLKPAHLTDAQAPSFNYGVSASLLLDISQVHNRLWRTSDRTGTFSSRVNTTWCFARNTVSQFLIRLPTPNLRN